MRVALVRGSLLRSWELSNYAIEGADVEAFASASAAGALVETPVPVRVLRSSGDVTSRLSPRVRGALELLLGPHEYLAGLERAVRGADIVHTLELAQPCSLQAVRARDAGACRAVVATVMENIAFSPTANRVVQRRSDRVAAGVDHFLAVTERARLHLETAGVSADRITVLPLGVDVERFAPAKEASSDSDGPLRVLCVSRLEPGKGVEDLAVAAGLLARRGVSVSLTYAGEGPSRGRIEEIAAKLGVAGCVTFAGGVPYSDLHRLHGEHDVFVLASAPTRNWREQFGFAVVEAMASGLPVVVGESGSLMEVVGNRPESLVPPHDPLTLADRLERLAREPRLRQELGAANRALALERYDVKVVRSRLREIYERVLASST